MDAPLAAPRHCCVCDAPGGHHCTLCKSRHYCSKKCQRADWREGGHKEQCRQLAANFQDRLLDELMPEKKPKEAPAIFDDVSPADGSKARLLAVLATAVVEPNAVHEDRPDWRGTCAICLELLPLECNRQAFYSCCCKRLCKNCSDKCMQYDTRCSLCRAPVPKSDAEWLRRLQKHADKGNADAQVQLGGAYRYGEGLKKSVAQAFHLYELAAAQGHAEGQVRLGACFHCGDGVKSDFKTAALWYRRAAEQGYPYAQFKLGGMFYDGKGVAQSHDEAVKWFRLAGAQGQANALYYLGWCYRQGRGVPRDDHEALRCYKRAAAKGHPGAVDIALAALRRAGSRTTSRPCNVPTS